MIAFPEAAVPATIAGILTAAVILLWVFFAELGILPVLPLFRPHPGQHQVIRVSVRAADHGTITRTPTADRPPWVTAGQPALTDAETLRLYRGDYGVTPVARVLEGERLAGELIA